VYVKPHFVDIDPGITKRAGEYALFIGRLAPEKGVRTMLNAWRKLTDIPLRVCGQGPLSSEVKIAAGQNGQITTTPRMSRPELIALLQNARFLVWPSEGYYETFGLVAIEAFACGVPVIASRVGVMQEIVSDGRTGLLFNPGDDDDMATKVQWAWKHRDEARDLGLNGRSEFETKYAPAKNYRLLVSIYESAINGKTPLPDTTRVSQGQFNLQCQTIRGGNH
jgi:glycosyltransferase involved in cell wall biosynthesis